MTGEADRYWQRNQAALAQWSPDNDVPLRVLSLYGIGPRMAIEIGAANGYRLAELHRASGTRCIAVEPSHTAIESGMRQYPAVQYVQATAANIPVNEPADLVIVNYVLHWIDRALLTKSITEIDRLVCDGGFLLLGDFLPDHPCKVAYHHADGIKTYKQDYSSLFLSTGAYRLVAMLTNLHGGSLTAETEEQQRGAVWLLQKSVDAYYRSAEL